MHLAYQVIFAVRTSLELCKDRAPRFCELPVVAAETGLVSANVINCQLEERFKVLGLGTSLSDLVFNQLEPAQEPVLRVHQTLKGFSPHGQIFKLFIEVFLGPQEELGRLLCSAAHVDLEIGLNDFERIIKRLWVLPLNLPDFLSNDISLGSVHKSDNLVDPPQKNPSWSLVRRLNEFSINLVGIALLHQVKKSRNLIPGLQATKVNRLEGVPDRLQSEHVHRFANILDALANH